MGDAAVDGVGGEGGDFGGGEPAGGFAEVVAAGVGEEVGEGDVGAGGGGEARGGGGDGGGGAEPGDEDAAFFGFGVLVEEESDEAVGAEAADEFFEGAVAFDDALAGVFAGLAQEAVDGRVLEGFGDAQDAARGHAEGAADEFPVAEVAGDADQGAGEVDGALEGGRDGYVAGDAVAGVFREPEEVEEDEGEVLEGLFVDAGFFAGGEGVAEGEIEVGAGEVAEVGGQGGAGSEEAGEGEDSAAGDARDEGHAEADEAGLEGGAEAAEEAFAFGAEGAHGRVTSDE